MKNDEKRFGKLRSAVVPLLRDHIDTDQIIPARFLKVTDRDSLANCAFADWRDEPDFPLKSERYRGAQVLLAGENFGCGSSREHAAWALRAAGSRAVVARSFGDIFRQNALKNALLPVALTAAQHAALLSEISQDGADAGTIEIDLERSVVVTASSGELAFEVDAFSRHCLMEGMDELDYLMGFSAEIGQYEVRHDSRR